MGAAEAEPILPGSTKPTCYFSFVSERLSGRVNRKAADLCGQVVLAGRAEHLHKMIRGPVLAIRNLTIAKLDEAQCAIARHRHVD